MSPKIAFPAIISFFVTALFIPTFAQENTPADAAPATAVIERAPTSAEIMRDRISKSKAMLAVKNYPAAEYELKSIKKESTDAAVLRVVNVLLMHTYIEQGDYPEAQKLLKEVQTSKGTDASMDFLAVAGQVTNCAREQTERYKALGLSVNDRNLPTVAIADIEGMRTTLELVIEQSKAMTADSDLRANATALLEETSNVRGSLARDAYDAKRWKDAVADAREQMMGSRSVIISAVNPAVTEAKEADVAASRITNDKPSDDLTANADSAKEPAVTFKPVLPERKDAERPASAERRTIPIAEKEKKPESKPLVPEARSGKEEVAKDTKPADKPAVDSTLPTDRPVRVIRSAERPASSDNADRSDQPNVKSTIDGDDLAQESGSTSKVDGPLLVGSLIGYATRRVSPVYPRQARSMRLTGVVTIQVLVDEDGTVAKISDTDGPPMLTQAASDAIRKWKFRPFERDGQPVKATGFVSFNFNL
jgi:protein TonB